MQVNGVTSMGSVRLFSQMSSPCGRKILLRPVNIGSSRLKEALPILAMAPGCTVARSIDVAGYHRYHHLKVPSQRRYYTKAMAFVSKNDSYSYAAAHRQEATWQRNAGCCTSMPLFKCNSVNQTSLERLFIHHYHTTCSSLGKDKQTTQSGCEGETSAQNPRNIESLIETWFYEVCPLGSIEVSLPFRTVIKPLHPQEHPDMNKVIIQLHYDTSTDTEIPDGHQLSQISNLYDLKVAFDEDKANMKLSCEVTKGVSLPVVCTIQIPLKYDLSLKMTDAKDLYVQKMESNVIVIESERGNCHLDGIKCGSISAVCRSGNIVCKSTLLGNIYFHTGKSGGIATEKLQGSSITCETEMGSVVVKSLYADNAIFRSDAGDIHLGHCHGQLYMLAEKSHFKIESLDGDLDIGLQAGSVEAHLSRHSKAAVEVNAGDISLSFSEGTNTDLSLDCRSIVVDKNLDVQFTETGLPHHKEGHIGEKGKALVNARTLSGTINLKLLDWIQTTKFAFQTDDEG